MKDAGREIMMKLNLILLLTSILLTSGCAVLDRSYLEEMDRDSDGFFNAGKDFPVVNGDSGSPYRSREEINKRTPSSERKKKLMKEEMSLKQELEQKVELMSESELQEYSKDIKYLPSDSDKLYYLSLSNQEKISYIETKKQDYIDDHGKGKDMVAARSIHAAEIYLGMSKDEVISAWGRPSKVSIAGNPKYQNELWMFNEDGSYKQVFFEGGKVNGWALDL
jgi:hypothetical protein